MQPKLSQVMEYIHFLAPYDLPITTYTFSCMYYLSVTNYNKDVWLDEMNRPELLNSD